MKAMDTGSDKEFERPKPGTFVANCFKVIDIGTQDTGFKDAKTGAPVLQRKIYLGWEINQKMTDGRPFAVQLKMTLSLHEKSSLKPFLEAWRGEPFTKEDLAGFEMKRLLGKPCMLSLVESEDKKYINVKAALKLPEGVNKMERVNKPFYFSLDPIEFTHVDNAGIDQLPRKMQEAVMASPEYKKLTQTSNMVPATGTRSDDIPF